MEELVIRTNKGVLTGRLYPESAPQTVKYFSDLVAEGFYNGLQIFKYVPGVLLQTGCPENTGKSTHDRYVKCELNGKEQDHKFGTIAMAHAKRNQNSSQFYICLSADFVDTFNSNNTCFGKINDSDRATLLTLRKGDIIEDIELSASE